MTHSAFSRYELRTKDPAAAREFYASIALADLDITLLPERAQAAGAPSHWLGHVAGDVERAIARGAQRIHGSVLRDPLGAVFAVADPGLEPKGPVVWHQRNTRDVSAARTFYREAFGWNESDGEPANVSFLEITRPGVHEAWLFQFRVDDLDATIAKVNASGGLVAGVFELPGGDRLAVCDDPQGAFVGFRAR